MLKQKLVIITCISVLMVAYASADLEFRDPDDVQFFTGIQMNNGNSVTGLPQSPQGSSAAVSQGYVLDNFVSSEGDSLDGDLDMNGSRIKNLPSPQAGTDPATKNYVDSNLSDVGGSQDLSQVLAQGDLANQSINLGSNKLENASQVEVRKPVSNNPILAYRMQEGNSYGAYMKYHSRFDGDTDDNRLEIGTQQSGNDLIAITARRSGNQLTLHRNTNITDNLNISGKTTVGDKLTGVPNPTAGMDAVNRQYALDKFVSAEGDSINGSIDMLDHKIVNMADPENPEDAVTLSHFNSNTQYIGDSESHTAGGNLDMNGSNITSSGGDMCIGKFC